MEEKYEFNLCTVIVKHHEQWMGTIFRDGTIAHARPNFREEDFKRCRELGYGDDIWAMNVDHELFHTALAEMAGEPYSQVLWEAAHGTVEKMDMEKAWSEEDRVLKAQQNPSEALVNYIQSRRKHDLL